MALNGTSGIGGSSEMRSNAGDTSVQVGNLDIAPSSSNKSWRLDLVACSFKSPVPHNTDLISQFSAVRWLNLTEISHSDAYAFSRQI